MERPGRRRAVVVTGASGGLGAGFARRFASRVYAPVLVARRRDRLEALAAELERDWDVRATVVATDLAAPDGVRHVTEAVAELGEPLHGLINCAGFGTAGPFVREDPARFLDEVAVNVTALTALTRALLPELVAHRGLLVNVSSVASHQPLPGAAVYAATKAYVTSLTEAIWQEHRGSGLRVLALCPGPVDTEFFRAAGSEAFKVGRVASVDQVLDAAFAALDAADPAPVLTVGGGNRARSALARIAPRRIRLAVAARLLSAGA